jgi:hypothetical protein
VADIVPKLQDVLNRFAAQIDGQNTATYDKVYIAITASPSLLATLNSLAESDKLTDITFDNDPRSVGASVSGTVMNLRGGYLP